MTRGIHYSAEAYLDAVRDALAAGETDALEGGVPRESVADRLDITPTSAGKRLTQLADEGLLRVVQGVDPETYHPRRSFLPVDSKSPKTKH